MSSRAISLKRTQQETAAEVNILEFTNRQRAKRLNIRRLREITKATLAELGVLHWNLGFHFVGPRTMARINQQHLNHEGTTDVITFDYSAPRSQTPDPRPHLHGEAFICVAVAVTQAREFGTSWESEVVRYIVHALLHLCGFDDLKPAARRAMKRQENRMVKKLARRLGFDGVSRVSRGL